MSRIKNFLFNKNLILNIAYTFSSLGFAIFVMMKYYIGYSGLGATIFYVIVFLSLFFTSALIFFDKEEAKNIWIMFGLGFLASYWGIFGWKNYSYSYEYNSINQKNHFHLCLNLGNVHDYCFSNSFRRWHSCLGHLFCLFGDYHYSISNSSYSP